MLDNTRIHTKMCSSPQGDMNCSVPYTPVGCPNAQWDFGPIGSPISIRKPRLPDLLMWDLPSSSDPIVFDLLYGHKEGLHTYLNVLQGRSAALHAHEAFPTCPEFQKNSNYAFTPPGIHPNYNALLKYTPVSLTKPYSTPPVRIDYGPVGSKLKEVKLVSDLPDLVKDIRFVSSLSHIRDNPHFFGKEVILGQLLRTTLSNPKEPFKIPALIIDPIKNTLVLNKQAIPQIKNPLTPLLHSEINHKKANPEDNSTSDGHKIPSKRHKKRRPSIREESPTSSSSDTLESISSAWSEKSLDYESISSGRLSVDTTNHQHVKSTWDSTSKSSCESTCEEVYSSDSTEREFIETDEDF